MNDEQLSTLEFLAKHNISLIEYLRLMNERDENDAREMNMIEFIILRKLL